MNVVPAPPAPIAYEFGSLSSGEPGLTSTRGTPAFLRISITASPPFGVVSLSVATASLSAILRAQSAAAFGSTFGSHQSTAMQ